MTSTTRLIAVCNPNNPTGKTLTTAEMDRIVALASKHDAWLLSDEVYRGAERTTDEITPSFYGRYEKVIAVGSMSKAYGLPGLRIGWAAAAGTLPPASWVLFAILFVWQIPHFLAIDWYHQRDYAAGGFLMLSRVDPSGAMTGRQ